ncbi:hypothetical protein [Paraburkholderia pallida]|uniref:Surface antigen n=1 Tax=Paraburkholderia pallida TaxID=2547399 RepID=A0A4P7D2C0_9BURK|nr:hypothetical protein [Paraburkholderia pallida]QBR00604.1 hypothetical protein E1956_26610 [Paraburkholderia pallida]
MRKLSFTGLLCGVLAGCTTPVASQPVADMPVADGPVCRTVIGTADIDGTPQQISGLACLQPDGSWQIVQGDDGTLVYPAWQGPIDYYGAPWYGVWPPFFVGASVVFVDRFHHFHHMDHVHAGGPGMRMTGVHGTFHSGGHGGTGGGFGGVHAGTVWSGTGSMGGGHRR